MKYNHAEKYEIIRMVEGSNLSIRKTLEQISVSRSTFYEWYRQYLEDGYDGLRAKACCKRQFWNRIPDSERQKIIDYARERPWKSCREIAVGFTDR